MGNVISSLTSIRSISPSASSVLIVNQDLWDIT